MEGYGYKPRKICCGKSCELLYQKIYYDDSRITGLPATFVGTSDMSRGSGSDVGTARIRPTANREPPCRSRIGIIRLFFLKDP